MQFLSFSMESEKLFLQFFCAEVLFHAKKFAFIKVFRLQKIVVNFSFAAA